MKWTSDNRTIKLNLPHYNVRLSEYMAIVKVESCVVAGSQEGCTAHGWRTGWMRSLSWAL